MFDEYTEQLFEMIERCKRGTSRAAALPEPRAWYMENGVIVSKPLESKAASIPSQGINKTKVIADFLKFNGYL